MNFPIYICSFIPQTIPQNNCIPSALCKAHKLIVVNCRHKNSCIQACDVFLSFFAHVLKHTHKQISCDNRVQSLLKKMTKFLFPTRIDTIFHDFFFKKIWTIKVFHHTAVTIYMNAVKHFTHCISMQPVTCKFSQRTFHRIDIHNINICWKSFT